MQPIALFGIQFTLSLLAYGFIGFWYMQPRLAVLPRELALAPLLWVHAFRVVGGSILAPGADLYASGLADAESTAVGRGPAAEACLTRARHGDRLR